MLIDISITTIENFIRKFYPTLSPKYINPICKYIAIKFIRYDISHGNILGLDHDTFYQTIQSYYTIIFNIYDTEKYINGNIVIQPNSFMLKQIEKNLDILSNMLNSVESIYLDTGMQYDTELSMNIDITTITNLRMDMAELVKCQNIRNVSIHRLIDMIYPSSLCENRQGEIIDDIVSILYDIEQTIIPIPDRYKYIVQDYINIIFVDTNKPQSVKPIKTQKLNKQYRKIKFRYNN